MTAYYSENDPFAAAWLRELIKENLIAPGEVDERSIEEVNPDDLRGFTQCHFFAGIGVWSYALRNAGWSDDSPVWTGSCPCQGFSASGQRGGFSDKRHLWPAWFRLIRECAPDTIFGEQVSSKDGLAWFDVVSADLEGEGYAVGAIDTCAAGVGAPHVRNRIYFVAHSEREQLRAGRSGSVASASRTMQGDDGKRQRLRNDIRERRAASNLDHPDSTRSLTRRQTGAALGYGSPVVTASSVSELVQPEGDGWIGRQNNTDEGRRQRPFGSTGAIGSVVDAECRRRNGREDQSEPDERGNGNIVESASCQLTNGFWRDTEWIYCRDEKYRPVEPGTFPLASGTPKRVGRLRGYGNALCAPQAQAFIEAYMEILNAR